MALILLQPGCEPLGQYDAADGYVTSCLGGEVCTFTSVTATADRMGADGYDGYLNPGTSRVALTINLSASATGVGSGPWMLVDEGTTNYGTLFGQVVGGTDGQVTAGTVLGPHTATGSGKWTAWDKPGFYGVTLDACFTDLQPTSATPQPGSVLQARAGNQTSPGFLTLSGTAGSSATMGRFVEFRTKGTLVTTPNRLVSALNSPSSTVSGVLASTMFMSVVHFAPAN